MLRGQDFRARSSNWMPDPYRSPIQACDQTTRKLSPAPTGVAALFLAEILEVWEAVIQFPAPGLEGYGVPR